MFDYWRAADYSTPIGIKPGKVHHINDHDPSKTRCGKLLADIGGNAECDPPEESIECKTCRNAWASQSAMETWQFQNKIKEAVRQKEIEERRTWYRETYLKSYEWSVIRQKVLTRSGGLCEGCGFERATEVHHLTYERVGKEMLFDLVAVCRGCHGKIHDAKSGYAHESHI